MRFDNDTFKLSRRALLGLGLGTYLSRFGLVNALAQSAATDYKALVCVFLYGGNDGNNMVIPVAGTNGNTFQKYADLRKQIALPSANVLSIKTGQGEHALHPNLTNLKKLYDNKNLAVVANVGPLVSPTNRAQYLNPRAAGKVLPRNLYSHSDQQNEWQSDITNSDITTGWAGRIADLMKNVNSGTYPMVMSVAGSNQWSIGQTTKPATVNPGQTQGLTGLSNTADSRFVAVQEIYRGTSGVSLVQAANASIGRGVDNSVLLNQAVASAPALTTVFPNTGLGNQMKQIARLIQVRSNLQMKRQIFFASIGGFDTHSNQLNDQGNLMNQINAAFGAFYDATVELGVPNQVTTFTASDFARTLQPNSTNGTDHAWGNHHFVMGGAVKGAEMYGSYPTLALGGPDDAGGEGRWIPSTSLDQYGATLSEWFGVTTPDMIKIFPNLNNFTTKNLKFV